VKKNDGWDDFLVFLMWALILGSMVIGGLRAFTDLEMEWWPFSDDGSGQCYYQGNVEICD
jgi:hypothetical protein